LIGIVDAIKVVQAKGGEGDRREMSFITLEDDTGMFELVLFPDMHARYGAIFDSLGPYRVRGRVTAQWDSINIELLEAEKNQEKPAFSVMLPEANLANSRRGEACTEDAALTA